MTTAVYVRVKRTNRNPVRLADTARRQLNYLGPEGFMIMKGKTDELFKENGHHRFVFNSRALAEKYRNMVSENCDSSVYTDVYKVLRKLPKPTKRK